MESLEIQMLGGFSIRAGAKTISDQDNRSRKLWALLAYLIYHRHRLVLQEELVLLLWHEGSSGSNPAGALKTAMHRLRTMLNVLWPTAGQDLILSRNSGYMWNNEIDANIDVVCFEQLCKQKNIRETELQQCYEVLKLYRGDFLPRLSAESWVIPVAAYYHNCYTQILLTILNIFMDKEQYSEVADLCRTAIVVEPFHEEIHCFLMKALLRLGDRKGAMYIYRQFRVRIYADFGISPGEEIRELFCEAIKDDKEQVFTAEFMQKQLEAHRGNEGAYICEYDYFRELYQFMTRYMVRSSIEVQVALFAVTEEISKRKLQGAMGNLAEVLRVGLRRGDTISQCSASQYIVMLPQTDVENGYKVCDRVKKLFYRKHPHSDAVIRYEIFSMQPEVSGRRPLHDFFGGENKA